MHVAGAKRGKTSKLVLVLLLVEKVTKHSNAKLKQSRNYFRYSIGNLSIIFQIVQSGAIPILVTMLQKAQGDDERLNACNTLWTLAFDEENKKEITSDKFAIAELRKLLTTENSELKRAASGALWECVGKEKYVEEKQLSVSAQEAAGRYITVLLTAGADLGGGCRGCAPPPPPQMTCGFLIQLVFLRPVTSQLSHSLVVHPLLKKILDPPLDRACFLTMS